MRILALVAAGLILSGCASLTAPEREIRVTEYGASAGTGLAGEGVIGGCRVVQTGEAPAVLIRYVGQRCQVATPLVIETPPSGVVPQLHHPDRRPAAF